VHLAGLPYRHIPTPRAQSVSDPISVLKISHVSNLPCRQTSPEAQEVFFQYHLRRFQICKILVILEAEFAIQQKPESKTSASSGHDDLHRMGRTLKRRPNDIASSCRLAFHRPQGAGRR